VPNRDGTRRCGCEGGESALTLFPHLPSHLRRRGIHGTFDHVRLLELVNDVRSCVTCRHRRSPSTSGRSWPFSNHDDCPAFAG
jgi:hypothetical protein